MANAILSMFAELYLNSSTNTQTHSRVKNSIWRGLLRINPFSIWMSKPFNDLLKKISTLWNVIVSTLFPPAPLYLTLYLSACLCLCFCLCLYTWLLMNFHFQVALVVVIVELFFSVCGCVWFLLTKNTLDSPPFPQASTTGKHIWEIDIIISRQKSTHRNV